MPNDWAISGLPRLKNIKMLIHDSRGKFRVKRMVQPYLFYYTFQIILPFQRIISKVFPCNFY